MDRLLDDNNSGFVDIKVEAIGWSWGNVTALFFCKKVKINEDPHWS